MSRKPRADDDEDYNICLGMGSIGDLRDGAPRGKRVSRPIGFVHFADRPEPAPRHKAKARRTPAPPLKPKRRRR